MHIPNLNKEQFETLLMIYASHVDYEFSKEEKDFILSRTDPVNFKTMYDLFLSVGDFTCLRTIVKYREKYYPTEQCKTELFALLKDLFSADGDFSRVEKVFVSFFKRIEKI